MYYFKFKWYTNKKITEVIMLNTCFESKLIPTPPPIPVPQPVPYPAPVPMPKPADMQKGDSNLLSPASRQFNYRIGIYPPIY